METILLFAAVGFTFLVVALGILLCEYFGAKYNVGHFTTVPEGTIKAVQASGEFIRFIPNINGHIYNEDGKIVEGNEQVSWFTKLTGLYYMSLAFPLRTILEFEIQKVRLKKDHDKIKEIEDKIDIEDTLTTVDNLRWKIDRPFTMLDVDLKDGTMMKILVTGIFNTWDPYLMLFGLGGKFFDNLDTLIKAYILSKCRQLTYNEFLAGVPIDLVELNNGSGDPAHPNIYEIPRLVGLKVKSLVIEEFSLSPKDEAILEAKKDVQVAAEQQVATATRTQTEYDRTIKLGQASSEATKLNKIAEVAGYGARIEQMRTVGVAPEHIAHVLGFAEMKELNGTFVHGGAGVVTTIPATHASQEPKEQPKTEPQASPAPVEKSDPEPEAAVVGVPTPTRPVPGQPVQRGDTLPRTRRRKRN